MNEKNSYRIDEARLFAAIMTFCGGFFDAFTYIQCGQTLAGAQTGNLVFLATSLVNHDIIGVINRCDALAFYIIGIVIAISLETYFKNWQAYCLVPILLIGGVIGAMPESFPDYISVGAVSFGLALFNTAFSKIQGLGYSSVFTTGNIKKAVVAWAEYFYHHRHRDLISGLNYLLIVLSFTAGAISSAIFQPYLRMQAIWVAVVIMLIASIAYYSKKKAQL